MWNSFRTDSVPTISAGLALVPSALGDEINAYVARPEGRGPYPGVVIMHHAPGFDEFTQEMARRLAHHGFATVAPDLYFRYGVGRPEDVAAAARGDGGVADDMVVADAQGALNWLNSHPNSNGKVGIIGPCSGGRHAVLVASRVPQFNAVVDLWGGGVVASPDQLTPKRPVAVIDLTPQLNAPILGLFGNDDRGPSPAQVDLHESALAEHGKTYFFHRYDGAGHGFFQYHTMSYRQQQAMDGWNKVFAFFDQYLA